MAYYCHLFKQKMAKSDFPFFICHLLILLYKQFVIWAVYPGNWWKTVRNSAALCTNCSKTSPKNATPWRLITSYQKALFSSPSFYSYCWENERSGHRWKLQRRRRRNFYRRRRRRNFYRRRRRRNFYAAWQYGINGINWNQYGINWNTESIEVFPCGCIWRSTQPPRLIWL